MKPILSLIWLTTLCAALGSNTPPACAHPSGNFSINHYARLEVHTDKITILYKLDFAEIASVTEFDEMGVVANGQIGEPARRAYLRKKADNLRGGLSLKVDGQPVKLEVEPKELQVLPGGGGLKTLKLTFDLTAGLPPAKGAVRHVEYSDTNYTERSGWKEVVAVAGPGVRLENSDAAARDLSRGLTSFPAHPDIVPPQQTRASFEIVAVDRDVATPDDTPRAAVEGPANAPNTHTPQDAFTQTIAQKGLTPGVMLLGLLTAFAFGAFHALSLIHGKALAAIYLMGSRGIPKHAIRLGLVLTITHTLGVFTLGLVTLLASKFILPERLYPVLSTLSSLAVFGVGIWLLSSHLQRLSHRSPRDLSHGHSHDHHDHGHAHDHGYNHGFGHHHYHVPEGPVTARAVALGVSGGIVPCPSALVLLLSAIALHRLAYGILLISAFSVGLAVVLIAIGLSMVAACERLDRRNCVPPGGWLLRYLPIGSAAAITVIGWMLVIRALGLGAS